MLSLTQQNPLVRFHSSQKTEVANKTDDQTRRQQELEQEERDALLSHAMHLTLSLYRNCLRSVEAIRHGNENDEKEFQERERKREDSMDDLQQDPRLSMLSMLPPVNRKDELRSRAEYYQQHAREMVQSEFDCLTRPSLMEKDNVRRYLHHLRQGESYRKWLLRDMQFEDPIATESLEDWEKSIQEWQDRAEFYCARSEEGSAKIGAAAAAAAQGIGESDDESDSDDEDDGFWTESDDDSSDSD